MKQHSRYSRADFTDLDVACFLAWCAIRKALRPHTCLHRPLPGIFGLVIPEGASLQPYRDAAENMFGSIRTSPWRKKPPGFKVAVAGSRDLEDLRRSREDPNCDAITELLQQHSRVIVLAKTLGAFPEGFQLMADAIVQIPPSGPDHVEAACRACLHATPSRGEAVILAAAPLPLISALLKKGRRIEDVADRVRKLSGHRTRPGTARRQPSLADLHGYGAAREWGLNLARDLTDYSAGTLAWVDIDRGVLLYGPPGTGKTIYVGALAQTCNVPLILGSLARWQSVGHLGDMLKAMRSAFAEANDKSPSILFIDEIDAIGDREKFSGSNAKYCREVVNALLECLDSADQREGVVVIGACNHPHLIDAAITRACRLDRKIEIPLPGKDARGGILRFHLVDDLPGADLSEAARRTAGSTGADLARLVQDGKRRARQGNRKLELDDLLCFPPPEETMPEKFRYRIAVHESGHAVAGILLGFGTLIDMEISPSRGALSVTSVSAGASFFAHTRHGFSDIERYSTELAVLLGGTGAKEIVMGGRTDLAGGAQGSDLHQATVLAAAVEACLGLGEGLAMIADTDPATLLKAVWENPLLLSRVERRLRTEFDRVRTVLENNKDILLKLAELLAENRKLSGDEARRIVHDDSIAPPALHGD